MNSLGQRIKIARSWRRQEDFANMLNVSRTTLASWEIDRREPDVESLIKIADFSKISLEWLLTGRETAAMREDAQLRNNPEWEEVIEFAILHQIAPQDIIRTLRRGLDFSDEKRPADS